MLQHKPFLLFISILYISRENQMHFRTDIKTCKDTKTQRCCFTPLGFAYRNILSEQQLQTHNNHPDIRTGLWNHQHAIAFLAEREVSRRLSLNFLE